MLLRTAAILAAILASVMANAQGTNPVFARRVTELTNQARVAYGMPSLRTSPILSNAAQAHAEDQARRGYVGHNTPEGRTPRDRIIDAGYDPNAPWGENIYNGTGIGWYEPDSAVNWWLNSPGHRANILNATFTEIGVGLAIDASGKYIYVQNFGGAQASSPGPSTPVLLWWTCTARGRVDAGIWGNWDGYGRGQAAARQNALDQCRQNASGCSIQSCRPGLSSHYNSPSSGASDAPKGHFVEQLANLSPEGDLDVFVADCQVGEA